MRVKTRVTSWLALAALGMAVGVGTSGGAASAASKLGDLCRKADWGTSSSGFMCAEVSPGAYRLVRLPERASTKPTVAAAPVASPKPSGKLGTRTAPIPLHTPLAVETLGQKWQVTVDAFDTDASSELKAANSFNDAAPAGYVHVLASFTVKFLGPDQ